jgi:hypothetical protein
MLLNEFAGPKIRLAVRKLFILINYLVYLELCPVPGADNSENIAGIIRYL